MSDPSPGQLPHHPKHVRGWFGLQVKHAQLLAQLHVSKGSYGEAATVLYALAMRKSGAGDSAVSLQQRLEHLRAATLQAPP